MIASPAAVPQRYRLVLVLITLAPFLSGLIMLDPDRAIIMGLASLSIMGVPAAMLILWPEARQGLLPRGRVAQLCGLVMAYAIWLAFLRAPHTGFSLTGVQFWLGAMVAGRMIQLAIRNHGPQIGAQIGHWALLALLAAGPLYITLLPLMDLIYGAQGGSAGGAIHWVLDMPGFNHIRKMGHLLTLSAVAGIGLVLVPVVGRGARLDIWILALAILALALALWTGARGAWAAMLLATMLLIGQAMLSKQRLHYGRGALLLVASIALSLLLPTPSVHLGILEELRATATNIDSLNALSSDRMLVWNSAVKLIGQAPLTGYGWGQYALIQTQYPYPQVHNFPLDLILGLGVPMGLAALGALIALWITAHRRVWQTGGIALAALVVLDTMAVYSLLSGTYYYGVPVVMTGLVWGISMAAPANPSGPIQTGKIQALFQ